MEAESSRAGCSGDAAVEEVEDALLRCIWLDFQGSGTGTVLGWVSGCPHWCSSSVYLQTRLHFWQGRREVALFSSSEAPRGKLTPILNGWFDGAGPTFGLLGVHEWEAMASPTAAVASSAEGFGFWFVQAGVAAEGRWLPHLVEDGDYVGRHSGQWWLERSCIRSLSWGDSFVKVECFVEYCGSCPFSWQGDGHGGNPGCSVMFYGVSSLCFMTSPLARFPTQTPTRPPPRKSPLKQPPIEHANKKRKKRGQRKSESSEGDEDVEEDPHEDEEGDDVLDIDSSPIENLDREDEPVGDLPDPLPGIDIAEELWDHIADHTGGAEPDPHNLFVLADLRQLQREIGDAQCRHAGLGSILRFLGSLTRMGVMNAQATLDDLAATAFTMAYEFMLADGVVIALCMPEQYIPIVREAQDGGVQLIQTMYLHMHAPMFILHEEYTEPTQTLLLAMFVCGRDIGLLQWQYNHVVGQEAASDEGFGERVDMLWEPSTSDAFKP
ncbi:hypothetical protein L7F22_033045 [Adiantum nelumboides]|nr:hypothetical protein [Adiantum nelumboides]